MGDSSEEEESNKECDTNKGAKSKDLVHKCHSDPGKALASNRNVTNRAPRQPAIPPRKCVLTLDGYSYVIGKFSVSIIILFPANFINIFSFQV